MTNAQSTNQANLTPVTNENAGGKADINTGSDIKKMDADRNLEAGNKSGYSADEKSKNQQNVPGNKSGEKAGEGKPQGGESGNDKK